MPIIPKMFWLTGAQYHEGRIRRTAEIERLEQRLKGLGCTTRERSLGTHNNEYRDRYLRHRLPPCQSATSIEPVAPHPGIGSNRLILLEVIERWLQVVPHGRSVDNPDPVLEFI
jgi:hypothetical protein